MENPIVLNFRDILEKYDQITAPITLVCAGNRRKEQNTVRKSKGFSWGPAGLSTALFTGPMMADILRSAKPLRRAKYVCMEGADKLVSHQPITHRTSFRKLIVIAKWVLWNIGQAQLGYGLQPGDHAGSQDERRVTSPGSRSPSESRGPRSDRRPQCQVAQEIDPD